MEQRLGNACAMSINERKFIEMAVASDLRIDLRGPFDYRDLTITFGRIDGSTEVQLGGTRVMSHVTSQLVQPYRDRENEGTLSIFTEFSPMADPAFEAGRPGELAIELGRIIDRGLRESRAVDLESLCVIVGRLVWSIRVDIHILDNEGNLIDAANIAALAALMTFQRPECTLDDDTQEVILHDPEVREPLPLIIHHLPIAVTFAVFGEGNITVIDPTYKEEMVMAGRMTITMNSNGDVCSIQKAGVGVMSSVIMQCLHIASQKASDITNRIINAVEANKTEKSFQKVKHYPIEVESQGNHDVGIMKEKQIENLGGQLATMPLGETERSSKEVDALPVDASLTQKEHKRNSCRRYTDVPIRGPSNWDPYSRGVSSRLTRSSLILSGPSTSVQQHKVAEENQIKAAYDFEQTIASTSKRVVTPSNQQKKIPKTLKDAVKLKNRKYSSNTKSISINESPSDSGVLFSAKIFDAPWADSR